MSRREMAIKMAARFNIVTPTLIARLFGTSKRQSLEFLNKLVKEKLLILVHTHRSVDNRVYTLSYDGAKFAEELLKVNIYYRTTKKPGMRVNQNTIMHDAMNAYICMKFMQEEDADQLPIYKGLLTDSEFKRIYKNTQRNVDGLLRTTNGELIAIEMEASFKSPVTRKSILIKWLEGIKHGCYQKIFIISNSEDIFKDIKRIHDQLFEDMTTRYDKKTRKPLLTNDDAELLKSAIIFRTKYCQELNQLFFP